MAVQQIGIRISVDAQSGLAELPRLGREFDNVGNSAEQASARATRSLGAINTSMRDLVGAGVAVSLVTKAVHELTNAITALPSGAFDYAKNLEVSQVGMSGILSSMTAINGKQTEYNQAIAISSGMIAKLNDDALRTAATSQELVTVFQALLAPGLAARMSLDEIRQLTVVGANAVKSIGLGSQQVVQELRDLVAGGITAASSTLATALGLKDSDIAKAKASSEGLVAFLMERMKGFQASSEAYSATIKGRLDQIKEGSIRVAADGFDPMIQAAKQALGEVSALFVTFKADGSAQLNTGLVNGLKDISDNAVQAAAATRDVVASVWEHRDAVVALAAGYAAIKTGQWASAAMSVVTANIEVANASRLAAVQAAAQGTANVEVAATSRMKIAALLAELEVQQAAAQAGVAATAAETAAAQAKVAHLAVTQEVIIASRAEVVAKMEATRTTIAQAEAQIVAARAAGAQSFALALVREGTVALSVAQAQQAVLMSELALLGRQQASVQAALVASTAAQALATEAQAVATNAAAAAAGRLTAANGAATLASGAASLASRGFGVAVAALGGPVGVGIAAVAALGIWLYKIRGQANDAAEAVKAVGRAEQSLATGRAVRDKDVRNISAQLEAALDKRDEIEGRAGNVAKNPTAQARQAASLAAVNAEITKYQGLLKDVSASNAKTGTSTTGLTLTLTGAEQAWKKANDGIKTSSAAQQEYETKLSASRLAWETYKSSLVASKADPKTIAARQDEQNKVEAALATERDKHIKQLGAGAAAAQTHALAAQSEAVKQGYKAIAAQTADGLDEIDSLRKQDLIGEYTALQRRTALQLQDIDAQKKALQTELGLARGKGTEQARLAGQLAELEQKRIALQNKAARDMQEMLVKPQLEQVAANYKTADSVKDLAEKQEAANEVFGKSKTAIELMTLATMKQQLLEAEGSDRFTPQYIASLNAKIAAQERYVRSLQGAEYTDLMRKEQDWLDQAKERASLYEDEQQLASLTGLERAKIVATRQIELRLAKELAEIDKGNLSDTQKEELRIKAKEAAQIDSSAAVNKVVQEDWQKTTDQINQSLTDAIMGGGKSGADYLKNLFRTMVLRPVISAVMSPVAGAVNSVVSSVTGALGLPGAANAAPGSGSGMPSLGSLSNLFGGVNPLTEFGTSATNAFYNLGGMATNAGFTNLGNVITTNATAMGNFASVAGDALGYLNSLQSLANGQYGAGIGSAIGTYFGGPIGSIIGSKVGGWIDNATAGEMRSGATYNSVNGKAHYQQGPSGGEIAGSDARNMFDLAQSGINDMLKAVGSKAVLSGFTAGLESSKNGKGFNFAGGYINGTAFGESLGRDGGQFSMHSQTSQEALTNYATELKQATVQALQTATDIPKTIAEMLAGVNANALASADVDALLSSISSVVATVNGFHDAVLLLPFEQLKELSFDAAAGLIKAAGGLDALSSNLSTYYDNFYSDAERRAQAIKNINAATAGSGFDAATATRSTLRALVDAQDVTTASGAKMYATLLAIAPKFATLADQTSQLAQETASKLLETFSARQQLVPLLAVTLDRFDALGVGLANAAGQALDMSSATGWINTLIGQASSGVLYFGDQVQGLDQPLTGAQLAAAALADQVLALKLGASGAATDIDGLSAALADVDTATFMATMQGLLKKVGDMFGDVLSSISNERIAVREAALSIINPAIMSKEQILRGIAGSNVGLPGNMVSAQASLGVRDAAVAAAVAAMSSVTSSAPSTAALDSAAAVLAAANTRVTTAQSQVDTYRGYGKFNWYMDQAYAGNDLRSTVPNPSGELNAQNVVFESLAANAAQQPAQAAYSAQLAIYDQQFAAYSTTLAAAQAQLDAATAQQTQALDAAKSAQIAYIDSLQNYAIDASKATAKLSDLREETVKYYQQQKALADLMTQSAGALRKTVSDYRYSQAEPEQQYAQLQTQFNTAYSMALSTSGETLAGYGDKLSSLVNPLLEKAQETGMSNSAYSALVSTVLARADATATRIDQLTPTNYAADSLAMLGQIDSTLFALEEGSKSAERVITDAINAGRDQTVAGLRGVIAAITGDTIPAFAVGGDHIGGARLVGEYGPELEVTGPSRIFNAAQTKAILSGGGSGSGSGGGGSVARLEALVERQNQEIEGLRADMRRALAAIANSTGKTAKILDRQETDGVLVRTSSDQPLETVTV